MRRKAIHENPVTDFLEGYLNEKTRLNYQAALISFFYEMQLMPLEEQLNINMIARDYLIEVSRNRRDPLQDLKGFSIRLIDAYAPTTIHLYLRCVIVWLDDNGYKVTKHEKKRITAQLPPPYPRIENIELNRKTFRQVYFSLPDDVGALFIVLLASGMRLGEALKLKKTDVDWNQKRVEVSISGDISKTKTPRKTYLTDEAKRVLLIYLYSRTDTSEKLFLITYSSAQRILRTVSEQLGYTHVIKGKAYGFHWHMTRKWFLSRFSLAASRDVAECLAGHEGYLSRSYRRYTKKQILKQYKRAERKLSILKRYE